MNPAILISAVIVAFAAYFSNQRAREFIKIPPPSTLGSGVFFDDIAPRYDLLNRIISLGMDTDWRRQAISQALPAHSFLDVSTGTADLAIAVAKKSPSIRVVGIDPSREMLARGREKITKMGRSLNNIRLIEGVAERLPFDDESFDAVVCAFGVRNFQNREKGLREMVRVLKSGGKLVVLELSMPHGDSIWDVMARVFVKEVMPKLASLLSGNSRAYQYLSASMDSFPRADEFKNMLREAGLSVMQHKRLAPFGQGPDLYTAVKREVRW